MRVVMSQLLVLQEVDGTVRQLEEDLSHIAGERESIAVAIEKAVQVIASAKSRLEQEELEAKQQNAG